MSREILRDIINNNYNCRIVAFYKNGGVAITKNNGYAYSGIPSRMANAIDRLIDCDYYIEDIVMSDDGKWLIVYNNNGFCSENLPKGLLRALHTISDNDEKIRIVAFNEYDNWIVVSDSHYLASDAKLQRWIRDGFEEYGDIEDIYLSYDAFVACYENGYKFLNIPDALDITLSECEFDIEQCSFNA